MAGIFDFLSESGFGKNPRALSGRQNVGLGLLGLGHGLAQMSAGQPVNITPVMTQQQGILRERNQQDAYRNWLDNMERTNPTGLAKLKAAGLITGQAGPTKDNAAVADQLSQQSTNPYGFNERQMEMLRMMDPEQAMSVVANRAFAAPEYQKVGDDLVAIGPDGQIQVAYRGEPSEYSILGEKEAQEKLGAAYDPTKIYQKSPDGKISVVGGGGVNINMGEKGMNSAFIESTTSTLANEPKLRGQLQDFSTLEFLLDEGVKTGFGADWELLARNAAERIGFDVGDLSGEELFRAISNRLIGGSVQELGRNPTDVDLRFTIERFPSLTTSPAGNRLITKMLKLSSERQLALTDWTREWLRTNKGRLNEPGIGLEFQLAKSDFVSNSPLFASREQTFLDEAQQIMGGGGSRQTTAPGGGGRMTIDIDGNPVP